MSANAERKNSQEEYPYLLSSLRVGQTVLQNRAVMGAMHTGLEATDNAAERIYAFYRARALGEVGLIITGGVAPNLEGRVELGAPAITPDADLSWHAAILDAVRGTETKVCMQILHTGRYAKFPGCVGASELRSRINRHEPRALTTPEVWQTVEDYAHAAEVAKKLGYHGVEIMGSEGYLINQFTAPVTNDRVDEFGGGFENRVRFPLEIIKATRKRVGPDFLLIYRISAVDLVDGGMTGEETVRLARLVESAGADIVNTGMGWHESTVPTVAHFVPRAAWSYAVQHIKDAVSIPVIASNRINVPQLAEGLIATGVADMVSMARPLLADPDFMRKVRLQKAESINICIACNQACLDHIFTHQPTSCLVNPRAGHETEFERPAPVRKKRLAVVGGGAAGMVFAFSAAERGHAITLYEASDRLGGQLQMARVIPEKTEFNPMLSYFSRRLREEGVDVRLSYQVAVDELGDGRYDEVVIATGVRPRTLDLPGVDHPKVLDYVDLLLHGRPIGKRVAIIGAGGIGFDVAEYLLGTPHQPPLVDNFVAEYGLDVSLKSPGGLLAEQAPLAPVREVFLLQRKPERVGARLAITTGWIRRDKLRRLGVQTFAGVEYHLVDDAGLHITVDGVRQVIPVDNVVVCAGQIAERGLYEALRARFPELPVHLIGGADHAAELDAKRAIDQATRLAIQI